MKKLLLLFLSISLLGGHVLGMKRKRPAGDDGGQPSKRQKKQGVYEQYLDENGWYCCPDCDYEKGSKASFRSHLFYKRHGHFKEGSVRERASIYDKYREKDGLYHCPDCDYENRLLASFTAHLSRKRHGHLKGRRLQEGPSIYDKYRKKDGLYHCPDCDYENRLLVVFRVHLSHKRHGHLKGRRLQEGPSIYDKYRKKDGLYYCSDCDYKNGLTANFKSHLFKKRHGHLKERSVRKRASIYDKYWGKKDGLYHCPDCDYSKTSLMTFEAHLRTKRHGHFKKESIQKIILENIVPQESIVIGIDEDGCDFELTVAPVFCCQGPAINSMFYALFNALCLLTNDIDLMYDREQLNNFVAESQGHAGVEKIIKTNKLLRPLASNLVVVDDVSILDFVEIDKNKQKIIILNLGEDHWIAIKVSCQNGENNVEIADALYAGFEDFEKLVNIAKRLV